MSPKKKPPVTAPQKSRVAALWLVHTNKSAHWVYYDRLGMNRSSGPFKTKDDAIKAALAAGFGAVELDGKVVARSTG